MDGGKDETSVVGRAELTGFALCLNGSKSHVLCFSVKQRLFHHFAGWLGEFENIRAQEAIAALRLSLVAAIKLARN